MSEDNGKNNGQKHWAVEVFEGIKESEAGKELESLLANCFKILNLVPFGVVWTMERVKTYLKNELPERLSHVPPERLIGPDPVILIPSAFGLRISGHNEELREMFAKLLATSMDSDTAHKAHPAFAEIIRQMTPDEARLIKYLITDNYHPTVSLSSADPSYPNEKQRFIVRHFSVLGYKSGCTKPELAPTYLSNLARLGLIEIWEMRYVSPETEYDPILNDKGFNEMVKKVEENGYIAQEQKEALSLTSLGVQFCEACVLETKKDD